MTNRDILAWVEAHHNVGLGAGARALVRALLDGAGDPQASVRDVLYGMELPPTTARWWLRKKRLPGPAAWRYLGRSLHAARYLQAHRGETIRECADALGYADHSALCHTTRRAFGRSVRQVRRTRGIAPLLARWWKARQPVGASGGDWRAAA